MAGFGKELVSKLPAHAQGRVQHFMDGAMTGVHDPYSEAMMHIGQARVFRSMGQAGTLPEPVARGNARSQTAAASRVRKSMQA